MGGYMYKEPLVAIVDDEKDLVNILKCFLSSEGIGIAFVAYDGFEAVELFRKSENKPDVILMDYWMPGLNGSDAAKQILAMCPEVKIIFLSAEGITNNEAIAVGAVTLIHKPASFHTIMRAINDVT
jgi:two-component system chemotaxis response regulator CheY